MRDPLPGRRQALRFRRVLRLPPQGLQKGLFPLLAGRKKVYFLSSQAELDELWRDLRNAGFTGDFLVQELIGGDDTHMDSLTLYIGRDGTPRLLGAAQVLLEDHAPTMLGNPVAMVIREKRRLVASRSAPDLLVAITANALEDRGRRVLVEAKTDPLWRDLRNAGYTGDFLVLELIGGDDTHMDSLTLYIGRDGAPRLHGAAQVLLEYHAPPILGHPVALVIRE